MKKKYDMIFYTLKKKPSGFNLTYQSSVVIYRVKSITGIYMIWIKFVIV